MHQSVVQILRTGETEHMAVIPEDAHFHFKDAPVGCLSSEPEIPIEPALAGHGSGKLHFRLEDDARLNGEYTDWTKPFQRLHQEIVQRTDARLFPPEMIFEVISPARMVAVDRDELPAAVWANPERSTPCHVLSLPPDFGCLYSYTQGKKIHAADFSPPDRLSNSPAPFEIPG